MKIAVLSGKGGTGKTAIAANLAAVCDASMYVDCDVEAPNGNLLFTSSIQKTEPVYVKIPVIDAPQCNGCRACTEFCRFNALAFVSGNVMVFREICHSCGGCVLVCPTKAIAETRQEVGSIAYGTSKNIHVISGAMHIGIASGIPIIKELWNVIEAASEPVFIDCPPGSACSVMESMQHAEYCVLVAEPTVFGTDNLKMVHELVKLFQKPYGVVLNKCLKNEWNPAKEYCVQEGIPILCELPFDQKLAEIQSNGGLVVRKAKQYKNCFSELLKSIEKEVRHAAAVDS
ncbi:MAG: 4Fe-4S binding protein [Megasphaera sp.]|jgi:MinD superfamily P-loop ATPase|uniref:nucleotide-binding protein n=1 Tax=Megasphaera sueciensis TaxID=349094 RepID=UPI003D06D519|nr:4Fe-4S binding protein [Megasphaera sp.]